MIRHFQLLPCRRSKPFGFAVLKRNGRRPRTGVGRGRRFIRFEQLRGEHLQETGSVDQVAWVKWGFVNNSPDAMPSGESTRRRERQGVGRFRVAPLFFAKSLLSPSFPKIVSPLMGRATLLRSRERNGLAGARQEPRSTRSRVVNSTTRSRARMNPSKQICPGGQAPDRLRARPSDEGKFSVSSPHLGQTTARRNRPRPTDL